MSYSQVVHKNRSLNSAAAVAVSAIAALALSACSGGGVSVGEEAAAEATSSPAATTSATSSATTSATTSKAQTSTAEETTTTEAPSGAIDDVQIVLQSDSEVSPGVYQARNRVWAKAEWMAVSGGAAYPGEKCAAVITFLDPSGNIIKTDRQSTCEGASTVELSTSKYPTGVYTVKVAIAPWDDAENHTEGEQTFEIIAWGT